MTTSFKDLFPNTLYHSYIVEGDPDTVALDLRVYLEERGDASRASSDVLCQVYNSFTVEDSEKIKEWHSEMGITETKKICIIGTKFINHDAERTLLKMIEEPKADTHFFIVVPNSRMLLDTILSRAHVIKVRKENVDRAKNALGFYKSKSKDRIKLVSDLIEEHKDSIGSGSVRFHATELINGLEEIVRKKFLSDKTNKDIQFALDELGKARDYLSLPGASVKMILEHLAIVI